jgi:hypothetical protein
MPAIYQPTNRRALHLTIITTRYLYRTTLGKNLVAFSQHFQHFAAFYSISQHLKKTIRLKQHLGSYIYIYYIKKLFLDS